MLGNRDEVAYWQVVHESSSVLTMELHLSCTNPSIWLSNVDRESTFTYIFGEMENNDEEFIQNAKKCIYSRF